MKDLKDILFNESKEGWKLLGKEMGQDFSYGSDKKYLWMNTEAEELGFMSETDIKAWEEDDEEFVKNVLKLKAGEMYDSDGGTNIYIKIK